MPSGFFTDAQGRTVEQVVRYYRAAADGPSRIERLKNRGATVYHEDQIKTIVKEVCETLEEAQDELFLYGFGRGAFLVRAVAGFLDTMLLPKSTSMKYFDRLYQSTMDFLKARKENDTRAAHKIVEFLRTHAIRAPLIQFVGVINTTKYTTEDSMHDISFVPSIRNLRHALAINETRAQLGAEVYETPVAKEMDYRSFIQAWFVGAHQDLGGGNFEDGLSLYPLQWILIDSMRAGLVLQSQDDSARPVSKQVSLVLAFPQYAGGLPKLDQSEEIEWQMLHSNGLQVSFFDLQSLHGTSSDTDQAHSVQINSSTPLYNHPPKVFDKKGLIGWCEEGRYPGPCLRELMHNAYHSRSELWHDYPPLGILPDR